MAQIPAAPPIYNDPPLKFFSKAKFIETSDIFGKPASLAFRKAIYVPTNSLKLQNYSRKFHFYSSNFQQILALKPNLAVKF
jgi:hypothetical protein